MPKFVKGSQEAKDHMANLRAMAKAKREALKNVSVSNDTPENEEEAGEEKEHWTTSAFLKDDSEESNDNDNVEVEVVSAPPPVEKKKKAPRAKKIIIQEEPESQVQVENDPNVPVAKKFVRRAKSSVRPDDMPTVNFNTNPLLAPKIIRFH
jgi:hypothetical protein